ncbi:hypothetical protein CEXT_279641 [Caerostris extrusa]|uniref:Uncharacterized protein n=1 Tax=Caerostris extrusa TaxID=172846 RepID=A0AAV4X238_CAEEX|nr:hypothetical protein CEXT_279641 [Caerostris extrusa]
MFHLQQIELSAEKQPHQTLPFFIADISSLQFCFHIITWSLEEEKCISEECIADTASPQKLLAADKKYWDPNLIMLMSPTV